MTIDNNAAFIWSDHEDEEFDGINSLEQLKHLIGAESIEGEYVGAISGGNNGLYIVGAASNWSITITFSFKSKFKYTLDGTTTIQNLSTTHTINAPAQNALLTELNIGILPQELYRINQSPQFFYAEVSTNNVSTGKINKSSIPVAGPTGAILNWVQVNNYGIATKSFQGPTTRIPRSTGLYTFNNPTGTGLKPTNFGLNEADYRILAVDWNKGKCTGARIENGHLIYTVDGQEKSIEVAAEVAENYKELYIFHKISNVIGQSNASHSVSCTTNVGDFDESHGYNDAVLTFAPNLTLNITENWIGENNSIQIENLLRQKFYYPIIRNFDSTLTAGTSNQLATWGWPYETTSYFSFYVKGRSDAITLTGYVYNDKPPTFSLLSVDISANGFDVPDIGNAWGGVGNVVYSLYTDLSRFNNKMCSPFNTASYSTSQYRNDDGQTFFSYYSYTTRGHGQFTQDAYFFLNCGLYFSSEYSSYHFASRTTRTTLSIKPSWWDRNRDFYPDGGTNNGNIFIPNNFNFVGNMYHSLPSTDLPQQYSVTTSFDTGYIIIAELKQPS